MTITEKLDVILGYSNADGTTSSGGEPREIPDSTFTVWASYAASDKFGWALGVMKQGESNIKDNNPGLVLPDYTRVDFALYINASDPAGLQVLDTLGVLIAPVNDLPILFPLKLIILLAIPPTITI